jgi:large subunit ribosomal protein L25
MPEITLIAEPGRATGSRESGRLRASGRIPGILYGHGVDPVPVAVDARALRAALSTETGLNALLSLKVGPETHLTMARAVQRHPVRNTVLHVDFQIVRRDEIVSAEVPLNIVGESSALAQAGGHTEQSLFSLTVQSTPGRIPTSIEVDVSEVGVGEAIRVGDLRLPEGVATDTDPDAVVVVGHAAAAPEEVVEAPAEGEAPAEPAASAATGDQAEASE